MRALGSVSDDGPLPQLDGETVGGGGPLPQLDGETVAAERAAGRGDSDAAVLALGQLVRDPSDPLDLARAECAIATGRVESPLRIRHWADQLAGLAADGRAGYERMLRTRRSALTLDAAISRLQATASKRADSVAIVNAYRAAGRATDPAAVEQLAALLAANGRSIAAVEQLLAGGSGSVTVDGETSDSKLEAPAEETLLAALPADHAAAYRAALTSLGKRSNSRAVSKTVNAVKQAAVPTVERKAVSTVRASGGATAAAGKGQAVRVSAEAFEGVADADKNAHLAMLLLVAHNVPADLAQWVATCTGTPPDPLKEMQSVQIDMEATTPIGNRAPIPPRARQGEGGYHGYRIFNAAGQTMSAAEIDADLARQGYIEVSLDPDFYREHIAPLLESPERWAWARADLIALSYQREIDDLEERERESFARTGRHDPQLMDRIIRLKGVRTQYATYAADLRSGKTSVTREMGRFSAEVDRLQRLIDDAQAKLVDARRRLGTDLDQRRREQAVYQPQRPATGVTPTADYVQASPEISREVQELEQYLADRREEKTTTEQMMGAGDAFPQQITSQRLRRLSERYETSDGSYKFRSNARATWNAIDGAASAASARLWAGIGGAIEYGVVLPFLIGQPWFDPLRQDLARRAYDVAERIDAYSAGRTAKAEEVLGKTTTMLIQVATSTAIYVLMLGPVSTAGGALGAALIGGRIGTAAGSMAGLAAAGGLMASDKGPAEMVKGALIMGAMPLFAGYGPTALRRAVSAFLGAAALDGAAQMDVHAALTAYQRGGTSEEILGAATERFDLGRLFANGLMAGLLAGGSRPEKPAEPVLRRGEDFYRADGTRITDAKEIAAASKSAVTVNAAELDAIVALGKAGNRAAALDLIGRAQSRSSAITETKADADAAGKDIDRLSSRPRLSAAEEKQVTDLRARRDRSAAQSELFTLAQEGRPIPRDLVERAGGQVPLGYAEASPNGDYVARPGLAAEQSAALRAKLDAGSEIAAQYKAELDAMNRLAKELAAEQGKPARASQVTRLRELLAAAAAKVGALRARFEQAVLGRETNQEPNAPQPNAPTEPIVVDPNSQPLGQGGQGTVYAVEVGGKPMAVKVLDGATSSEQALAAANLPARFGGLGSGQLVQVKLGDALVDGVLMPRVPGTPLSRATRTLPSHAESFDAYMAEVRKQEVVLADLHEGNVLVGEDGRLVIVDAPLVTFQKFTESAARATRSTPEQIAGQWKVAREQFEARIESIRRTINEKLGRDPSSTTPTAPTSSTSKIEPTSKVETSQVETRPTGSNRDITPTERPPLLDDEIIQGIAAKTEADVNNIIEGTCATAALRNTISAQLRGMNAYVIEIEGLTRLGRILERLGAREGNVGKLLEKLGASTTSAHAIAAIQGTDGSWRYLSWGRVEADYQIFAREAYGETFINRGTWETGDHVRWMLSNKWEYPNPTKGGRAQRALFGWMLSVGK